jgi:hypothetical protein
MNKKQLTELLGYEPGAALKKMILSDVKTTGKSIEECADAYAMPPLFVPNDKGEFEHEGKRFTSETFAAQYPHRRFTIIKRQKYD